MRLHSSIGCYDYRWTARLRQGIRFSIIPVLFADHMHRRFGVHNKFSFHRFKSWCRQASILRRWEECCFIVLLNFLKTLLASFPASSRAPCSCHSVSSWDRSWHFGALGLRWWGSPGQIIPNEGFWSPIFAWRAMAFVIFARWIGFCMSELFRKIDDNLGGSRSWKKQPNCRVFDELHTTSPWRSWHVSRQTTGFLVLSYNPCFFNLATALLSPFFWDLLRSCSSTWRCAKEHLSPNLQPNLQPLLVL